MKKIVTVLLAAAAAFICVSPIWADGIDPELIAAAQADGELVVYGSCEEDYLQAACDRFELLYDVKVTYQRLSSGEVQSRIEDEEGNPSADVWFGGTTDPYNVCAREGLLQPYEAVNSSHLINPIFRDKDGFWYGIYWGILGFIVNTEKLESRNLEIPQDWQDLLKKEYKNLIWMSNYNTAGTARLILNTMIQKYGHDEGIRYLVDLDRNVQLYTRSGSTPAKNVGSGSFAIAVGFLHDGISQMVDNGFENLSLIVPSSGTSFEIGATAIFKGARHENAAKLWIEYALSPECVEQARECSSYQFLVIDNAKQPPETLQLGLDADAVPDYDFEDAQNNTTVYITELMEALGSSVDDRFQTS
ncbi:MAG: ABC transporter substrate-binding protein [Blautia sp.]|nr:ABC transporter substrate-binding protein [Blautia sp.]